MFTSYSIHLKPFITLMLMATVKVKLRPSSVEGKAGVIYYQITHNRKTQQITTRLRVHPSDWDSDEEKLVPTAPQSFDDSRPRR